jgi:hypothetical protein
MDNIIEPNESFDFSNLSLAHPSGIQGGAYFTKILYNSKPLYIQTVNSLTRQGVVKSGKKHYCDLMFDNNAETLINWFENLEDKCQKLLFEKNESWFQNSLNLNDIEGAFNPTLRVYKSGKYYLIRTNIKNTPTNEPNIKIYNENEITLGINDITNETNIISILEIQGIKFTSRSFQIDIELKQVMVLDKAPVFDNCVIKTLKHKQAIEKPLEMSSSNIDVSNQIDDHVVNNVIIDDPLINDQAVNDQVVDVISSLDEKLEIVAEDLSVDAEELREVDMNINIDDIDTMTLKKPNEVYFELYKDARNKAKQAKKSAIIAYLEAKNIKKTYMLDNLNDSDSEFDAEIDEVSESELEGL